MGKRTCIAVLAAVVAAAGFGVVPMTARAATGDCLASVGGVDLNRATMAELQTALKRGVLTSVRLVEAYERRIAAFDRAGPKLNAVRHLNANARAEAARLDRERAAGKVRGPLHGIPVLLKDNIGTSDAPTTAGSIALAGNRPKLDATVTANLRAAGAVILGKTNLSEFANWVSLTMPNGYSSLGGQVVNAYTMGDPSGSSSGSGVAGSMAFAAGTVGSETQGSILSPSDANSLVGVKPTVGLVSRTGIIPLAASFDTAGPMTRSVADAATMLGAMVGPDPRDPVTSVSAEHLPRGNDYVAGLRKDSLKGVRLGYDPDYSDPVVDDAIATLTDMGAVMVPISQASTIDTVAVAELTFIPNEFKYGLNRYLATEAGAGLPVKDLTGIVLYNNDHPDEVKYGQDLLVASDASAGDGNLMALAIPFVAATRAVLDGWLEQNDVAAIVGPRANFVAMGAAAGYPSVAVPAGYDGAEPGGITFAGTAWSEPRLLSYAYAFEQATLRREPPTVVNPDLLTGVCS
ncbi:MAG TPA: amidase family protein [Acidimicrobiales bacterium]|nr:amidase family protein [Acidimicrobiales bacterium]